MMISVQLQQSHGDAWVTRSMDQGPCALLEAWGGFSKEALHDMRTNWFNKRRGAHFKLRH